MTAPAGRHLTAVDRLRKLRAMSLGELWTRVRYDAYCRFERARHGRGALGARGRLRRSLVPALARRSDWRDALLASRQQRTVRFFAGVEHLAERRADFFSRFPSEHEHARLQACRALQGEFSFFGGTYRYNGRVDWHADPVTRAQWPRVYHRDVPVAGGDVGFGDVKHVWELGRHQFLIDLAKGWGLDRDPRYSAVLRRLVADWQAENPVGTGVGWSCSLEPAFRALSWLWAYFLTADDPAFDPDAHVHWLEGFHDHGWFIYRHLEYHSSPFNHLMGEACALYCLGVLFPEFDEAPKWRQHGRHLLESRLPEQFYADGASVEQSTFYHHATTGFYLLAALLGRANGEEFSHAVWRAIERGIEFSMLIQQPDGTVPRIGGADDGKPIRLEHLPFWDFRPYQAIGAVLFDRGDFKASAGRFYEDALWLLGPEGARRFESLNGTPPVPASRALEASGYVIVRDGWHSEANYLCFDCGEQAAGLRRDGIASAAHGHADCLSVIIWRKGRPVLVDPGFYCYNGPKAWQDHFRETAAHNTLRVDGRDQAFHVNKMAWSHTYTATLEAHDLTGPAPWMIASHDGYRTLSRGPVHHRRVVWIRPRGYLLLCDFLDGAGDRDVEVTFQFAPGPLALGPCSACFDGRVDLFWFASAPLSAQIDEGGEGPAQGWIAPSLGVRVPAPRLALSGTLRLPATIVTVLADRGPDPLQVAAGAAGAATPLRIFGPGWTDIVVVKEQEQEESTERGFDTDALVAAWCGDGSTWTGDGIVGGSYQR